MARKRVSPKTEVRKALRKLQAATKKAHPKARRKLNPCIKKVTMSLKQCKSATFG